MTNSDDNGNPPVPPVPPPGSNPYAAPTPPPAYAGPPVPPPATGSTPYSYASGVPGPQRGLSIASMICGIASVVFAPFLFGFLPGVAAVVTGHMAQRRQPEGRPFWLTGLITGYIGIAIGVVQAVVIIYLIVAGVNSGVTDYGDFS